MRRHPGSSGCRLVRCLRNPFILYVDCTLPRRYRSVITDVTHPRSLLAAYSCFSSFVVRRQNARHTISYCGIGVSIRSHASGVSCGVMMSSATTDNEAIDLTSISSESGDKSAKVASSSFAQHRVLIDLEGIEVSGQLKSFL